MYDIIGNKKIFLGIAALLMTIAVASIGMYGLKQGIDFKGGTAWQMRLAQKPSTETVSAFMKKTTGAQNVVVIAEPTTSSVIVRLPELSEKEHADYRTALEKEFGAIDELSYETIGPAVGGELRSKAAWAFLSVILAISLYITFAFRHVSRPVSSWKYGVITMLTLFHDALLPLGLVAWLGHTYGVEIDTNIVVALLVIMGFSVHDTIVVFDRIRENLRLEKSSKINFPRLVNTSVNQTLVRSVNTSITLVLTLIALLLIGSANLFWFVLVITVGVVAGTYSSIFVASPLLTLANREKA